MSPKPRQPNVAPAPEGMPSVTIDTTLSSNEWAMLTNTLTLDYHRRVQTQHEEPLASARALLEHDNAGRKIMLLKLGIPSDILARLEADAKDRAQKRANRER